MWKEFEDKILEFGVKEDLRSLTTLELNFFERYGKYTVLNLREFASAKPNNMLVLSEKDNFLFSNQKVDENSLKLFKYTLKKDYGESTVLALLTMKKVLLNYSSEFEQINLEIDRQEEVLDAVAIERLARHLRKLNDAVEDFFDVLIKLEDREVREVNTSYVSYDYDVLRGKTRHLLDRIKSHVDQIAWLRDEIELKTTREVNKRLESLTNIMNSLTALTVILMIPNIVAGHFGMNFANMPLLKWEWGETFVIASSLSFMGLAAFYFSRKEWI